MPDWKYHLRGRLAPLKLDPQREADIIEEVALHLDERYREALASGASDAEAVGVALAELDAGGLEEELRSVEPPAPPPAPALGESRGRWLYGFGHDIRYALRTLRKNPGFALVAILTLALGIGANTAVFSVVYGVLLRDLPYAQPGRLHMVWFDNRTAGNPRYPASYLNYQDLRAQSRSFEHMAAASPRWSFVVRGADAPEQLYGQWFSASLFPTLGVQPIVGRAFTEEDDKQEAPPVALISYGYWQRRFGGDPSAVGKTLDIDGNPVTLIGVMPPGFRFLKADTEIYAPLALNPFTQRGRRVALLDVVGRLAPGVTRQQAQAEMATISAQLEKQYPESNTGFGANVEPLDTFITGNVRTALLVLMGTVVLVLLIACVNLANLLLMRVSAREKEIALRVALGAGRARLLRQLLTESVLLALMGSAAGLALAWGGVVALKALAPATIPRLDEIVIDPAVLAFTLGVSVFAGIFFGLVPAWEAVRADLHESLKEGGRTTLGSGRGWTRRILVVAEVAMALVLLTGAGLLTRSFATLLNVEPGFDSERLLTLQVALPAGRYQDPPQRHTLYARMFDRLVEAPGVEAAGGVTRLPLGGGVTTVLEIEGSAVAEGERPEVEFRRVTPDYFRAMGVRISSGRGVTLQDTMESPPVCVINQALAERHFGGRDPIGQRVRFFGGPPDAPWFTIVGVVGDVKHFGLDSDARPEVYMAFAQGTPPFNPLIAVRTSGDAAAVTGSVRQVLRELDSEMVIYNVATMDERLYNSMAGRRFNMLLLGVFAALAVVLAGVGIYGVLAYAVRQRIHEIGIRLALGAQPGDVLRMILRDGMALAITGIAIGVVAALAAARVMVTLLFGVPPTDPLTFAATAALLTGVALLACWIPARRATRVDPMVALRHE